MRERELISQPDSPVRGFIQGSTTTAFAVGVPLVGQVLVMALYARKPLLGLAFCAGATLAASLAAGISLAIWRQVQCWAYDRFLEGPP
jgi:hypothetical protein